MKIYQEILTLPPFPRGFHLITSHIEPLIIRSDITTGLAHIFLQHTSASLCINENADPSVRDDFESFFSDLCDNKAYFTHTYEGDDDKPAHLKSAILSPSLTIPITANKLALGTWQGIYLGEHREYGGKRKLIITLQGG